MGSSYKSSATSRLSTEPTTRGPARGAGGVDRRGSERDAFKASQKQAELEPQLQGAYDAAQSQNEGARRTWRRHEARPRRLK